MCVVFTVFASSTPDKSRFVSERELHKIRDGQENLVKEEQKMSLPWVGVTQSLAVNHT